MSPAAGATALVLAAAPLPGACPELEPLLGPEGCARLQAVLLRRAAEWARTAVPGGALVAVDGDAAGRAAARAVLPADVELVGDDRAAPLRARIAAAVAGRPATPLLVAGTACPALGPVHAQAVFDDLAAGFDVSAGPMLDGGCYLAGVRDPALLALPVVAPDPALGALAHGVFPELLASATAAGLAVGALRFERRLCTPADAAALLVDPLAPADIRAALAP